MKEKMHVYIITKEGREYNDEGLKMLTENLAKYGCTDPTFVMGGTTNNPLALAAAIKENSDGIHIVLSHKTGVLGVQEEAHEDLYTNLMQNPDHTSYEIISEMYRLEP